MANHIVWDSPAGVNCLQLDFDGSAIVSTKETVIVYSPRFFSSGDCETRWVTLSRKSAEANNATNPAEFEAWFQDFRGNNSEFKLLCFQQVQSCRNCLENGYSSLLCTLLTNGSLFFFNRDISSSACYDHDLYQLKVSGYALLFDFDPIYVEWCVERQLSSSIDAFCLFADVENSCVLLAVGGRSHLSLWLLRMATDGLQCRFVADYDVSALSEDHVSTLRFERDGNRGLCILAGTSNGHVHHFQVLQAPEVNLNVLSTRTVGSGQVSFTQLEGGAVHLIAGNKMHIWNEGESCSKLSFTYPISGLTSLVKLGQQAASLRLCSTIDGTFHAWGPTNGTSIVTCSSSRDVRVACSLPAANDGIKKLSDNSDKSGLYGLVADPFALMLVTVVRLNPVHDNSRETQLNKAVWRTRVQVHWKPSPFVDQGFGSDVLMKILTHVVNTYYQMTCDNEQQELCLSSVVQLFCLGVQTAKDSKTAPFRPKADVASTRNAAASSAVVMDVTNEAETSDSEVEEDVAAASAAKRRRTASSTSGTAKSKVSVKVDVDAIQLQQQEELRQALISGSNDQRLIVEDIVQKLMAAAENMVDDSRDAGVYGVCNAGLIVQTNSLFVLPLDTETLLKRMCLWRVLHAVFIALHHSFELIMNAHWKAVVMALKQSIMGAECILALNRCEKLCGDSNSSFGGLLKKIEVLKAAFSNSLVSPVHNICATALQKVKDAHLAATGTLLDSTQVSILCSESCFICGASIAFVPKSFDTAQCASCGLNSERCCRSLQMILQPERQNKLLRCACCKAVMIVGQSGCMFCVYCSVAMYDIV